MLPASLADDVPVFIATPTSAWASAGASLVPSPVIATRRPPSCSFLISAILSSGVASARKSSTPASSAIARAVSGLSPVIITVRMPIRRISSNRSRMPSLTTSLRWMTPRARARPVLRARRPRAAYRPRWRWSRPASPTAATSSPPCSRTQATHRRRRALADLARGEVDARHPGLGGELHEVRLRQLAGAPLTEAVGGLGEYDDRAALRRLVGEAGELCRIGELRLADAVDRQELARLPVAQRDGAGLVEQQRVHVAGRLDRRGPTWPARCAAPAGPCRRCRWPRAARRSWSGSGRRAGRRGRPRPAAPRCRRRTAAGSPSRRGRRS